MARPYRQDNNYRSGNGYDGYGYGLPPAYDQRHQSDFESICDDILAAARRLLLRLWVYVNGRGRVTALNLAMQGGRQVRRNLTLHRLLSFPHLLVVFWMLVLLWGERWVFASRVQSCDWDHWEKWPAGAKPHHLVFVADPQIIDPHSYPGRPWPLNPLTVLITDNYLRRSYTQLQKSLKPDTVFFLGDLFDGGREWKTSHGDFSDPEWAKDHRPASEKKYLKEWNKKYGDAYWLKEYGRFGDIFFRFWTLGGIFPARPGQRGRKIISSLPGNHDLGFGAEVKIPARQRFNAYFGETNRVDVIGNHTFVSVDTVSLSASTSSMKDRADLGGIYKPVEEFLSGVKAAKWRAVARELKFWRGEAAEELTYEHIVEDLDKATFANFPTLDPGEGGADFPTVLLSHVPLYRDPGTPCGPNREHWPPTKPPNGQTGPVIPDPRNAISVSGGYQYQNVLNEEDSIKLVKSIGNVKHAFSGDDHDYCEVVHNDAKENVREITVKSLSMAMGVPTPGFQMLSLYNPVDGNGRPLSGSGEATLQTHLCLLPKQLSTFATYAALGILTIVVLIVRAFLVPILNLQPFALDSAQQAEPSAFLPVFKAKVEADPEDGSETHTSTSATSSSKLHAGGVGSTSRGRSGSLMDGYSQTASPKSKGAGGAGNKKWNWSSNKGPRIEIRRDVYDAGKTRWRAASRQNWRTALQSRTALVGREIWTTSWRVVWMAGLFYAYLAYKG